MPALRFNWITRLVLLALLGVVVLVARNIEWVEKEVDTGFSGAALKNRFLAAKLFLDRYDIAVEQAQSVTLLDAMPPTGDLIVMTSTRRTLSPSRIDALLDWVADGGRLVLVAVEAEDENEDDGDAAAAPILEAVNVRMRFAGSDSEVSAAEASDGDSNWGASSDEDPEPLPRTVGEVLEDALAVTPDSCQQPADLTRVTTAEAGPVGVEFWNDRYLVLGAPAAVTGANNDGIQVAIMPWGSGSVVAMTSVALWQNRHIHCHDNAHLLKMMTNGRKQTWWVFDTEMEPLQTILWNRWPWLVAFAALWLLAWSWHAALRTRAPIPNTPANRRNVLEHIDGVARFYYQQGEHERLLDALRALCHLDGAEVARISRLAEQLGETPDRIRWALTGEISGNSQEFTVAVQILQRIKHTQQPNPGN